MLNSVLKKPDFWPKTSDLVTKGSALVNSSRRVTREHVTDDGMRFP